MQAAKLAISQKVFAQLERIFKRTGTRLYPLSLSCSTTMSAAPVTTTRDHNPQISAPTTKDLLHSLQPPRSNILSAHAPLQPSLHELRLWTQSVTVHSSTDFDTFAPVSSAIHFDFTSPPIVHAVGCQVNPQPFKTTPVDIHTLPRSPLTRQLGFAMSKIKTTCSTTLPGTIPVIRHPLVQTWLPKSELRVCWRKAVLRTKRNPQELKMMGFFSGIPVSQIKRIEFSHDPVHIRYWLVDEPKKKSGVISLSLFQNIAENEYFLTSSQDE